MHATDTVQLSHVIVITRALVENHFHFAVYVEMLMGFN